MRKEIVEALTRTSAANEKYRSTADEATNLELRAAVTIMAGKPGNKARIAECDRQLKKRGALKNESF